MPNAYSRNWLNTPPGQTAGSAQAHHKRRRDDGQQRNRCSAAAHSGARRTLGHQRHESAQQRGAGGGHQAQEQRVPATPQRWPHPFGHDRLKLRSCAMRSTPPPAKRVVFRKTPPTAPGHREHDEQREQNCRSPPPRPLNRSPLKKTALPQCPNAAAPAVPTAPQTRPSPCRAGVRQFAPGWCSSIPNAQPRAPIGKTADQQGRQPQPAPPEAAACPCPPGWQAMPGRPPPASSPATARGAKRHRLHQPVGSLLAADLAHRQQAIGVLLRIPERNTGYPSTPMASQTTGAS